jgi:hypothetical protein
MVMTDRFDLEQSILKCWNVTDDIDLLYENVMDRSPEMTTDDIANTLLGMKQIYEMRFEKLFSEFEKLVREKKIL